MKITLFKINKFIKIKKFLDLFLSIHGDYFLLNPRSSFSWQVYVVRVCLGTFYAALITVPTLHITSYLRHRSRTVFQIQHP